MWQEQFLQSEKNSRKGEKKVQGWLIYKKQEAERNQHAVSFYLDAAAKRGVSLTLMLFEQFSADAASYGEKKVEKFPDFVIMRADVPAFSAALEQRGIPVFNNARLSFVANDKWETVKLARTLGVPTPVTCLATKENAAAEAAKLGYPLVMKPRDGHGGQDVLWIASETELRSVLLLFDHDSFLLQQPVSDLGRDLRVYVLGGCIVAAMLRSREDDFRSNYCLGGTATIHTLTEAEQALVETVIKALPMDFAGVDLLYHNGQPVLGEIEDVVGARMLYHVAGLSIIDDYVDYIIDKLS